MPNLTIKDANGTGVIVLGDVPTGPGLMLFDRSGAPRAQFDVGDSGPRLYLEDAKGFSTTVGSYFTGDPAKDNKATAATIALASKVLGVFWSAPYLGPGAAQSSANDIVDRLVKKHGGK
jgi:hypothetical protein